MTIPSTTSGITRTKKHSPCKPQLIKTFFCTVPDARICSNVENLKPEILANSIKGLVIASTSDRNEYVMFSCKTNAEKINAKYDNSKPDAMINGAYSKNARK